MKLNKFFCTTCSHEFYDSESASTCDSCGTLIKLRRAGIETTQTIKYPEEHILEGTAGGTRIREAVSRSYEDSSTIRRALSNK
jgi:hypothetical protein